MKNENVWMEWAMQNPTPIDLQKIYNKSFTQVLFEQLLERNDIQLDNKPREN